jgi:GMP synthase (glutamine-hydrolysing)
MGFHWHGDTFDLPAGAVRLFESDLFANQGFRWGRNVLALQFHFEVDRAMVAEWLADAGCAAEVAATAGISAQGIQRDTATHGEQLERLSAAYFTEIVRQLTPNTTA